MTYQLTGYWCSGTDKESHRPFFAQADRKEKRSPREKARFIQSLSNLTYCNNYARTKATVAPSRLKFAKLPGKGGIVEFNCGWASCYLSAVVA